MKKIFVIAALLFTFNNVANASVASAEELQEKAAVVMAQEIGFDRDQINQLKGIIAQSAPIGDLNRCSDYGFMLQQNMRQTNPSLSDKASDAIKDFGTWGCAAKNGR